MNDLQQGFGSLHYAYLTIPDDLRRLCHFALRAAFPLSLVDRYSHDYYWHSVTLGLSPLRQSRIPLALDVSSVT
jgi:hypothetical protein